METRRREALGGKRANADGEEDGRVKGRVEEERSEEERRRGASGKPELKRFEWLDY